MCSIYTDFKIHPRVFSDRKNMAEIIKIKLEYHVPNVPDAPHRNLKSVTFDTFISVFIDRITLQI